MGEALGDKPPYSQDEIRQAKADEDYVKANMMFQENSEWKEHRENIQKERDKVLQEQRADALKKFNEGLPKAIPEWADREKAEAESKEVYQYLRDQGYNDQWMANLIDPVAVAMVRKAMLFDKGEREKPKAMKKVAQAPKMVKPGTPKTKASLDKDKERKLLKRVESAGDSVSAVRAAADFLRARRNG